MTNIAILPQPVYPVFASRISPWSCQVEADTLSWINSDFSFLPQKMQLKYQLSNFGRISARCLPEMKSYAHLQVAARFMLWGTIFDDYYEFAANAELQRLDAQVQEVLSGNYKETENNPFLIMISEMHAVLNDLMPGDWIARFAANVGIWIHSMLDEIPYKQVYHFPALDDFLELRTRTIGVQAYLDLIELQLAATLPDEVMLSPYFREVYRLAARIFASCNDFYSLLKDIDREPLNLVLVLQHQYRLSLPDAHSKAMEIHDQDVQALIRLMECPPDFGRHQPSVRTYMDFLGSMIQGQNVWYQKDTLRYQAGGYPEKGSFVNQE